MTEQTERERVVAWLRERAAAWDAKAGTMKTSDMQLAFAVSVGVIKGLNDAARALERGDHLKGTADY